MAAAATAAATATTPEAPADIPSRRRVSFLLSENMRQQSAPELKCNRSTLLLCHLLPSSCRPFSTRNTSKQIPPTAGPSVTYSMMYAILLSCTGATITDDLYFRSQWTKCIFYCAVYRNFDLVIHQPGDITVKIDRVSFRPCGSSLDSHMTGGVSCGSWGGMRGGVRSWGRGGAPLGVPGVDEARDAPELAAALSPVCEEPPKLGQAGEPGAEPGSSRAAAYRERAAAGRAGKPAPHSRQAFSLELVSQLGHWADRSRRRTRSCEGDYRDHDDRLEITQFERERACSADPETGSGGGESPSHRSKVRYNDAGSFDDVDDGPALPVMPVASLSAPGAAAAGLAVTGTQVPRQLWSLRSTFEEEEDFSDKIRMEDMMSAEEQSAEADDHLTTSMTTSFESNAEPHARGTDAVPYVGAPLNGVTYRAHAARGPRQPYGRPDETSFDSVDAAETDLSDTSRCEVTTTSFESTTTTDSTSDSQGHRLQQMRDDSGYKSLETQQSSQHSTLDIQGLDDPPYPSGPPAEQCRRAPSQKAARGPVAGFDRRSGKTASKKRRDFGKERQLMRVCDAEPDSRSDQPSGDSFDDPAWLAARKHSVFSRFLKSRSADSRRGAMARDYSVDEKTDAVFNEFLRYDPAFEQRRTTKQPQQQSQQHPPPALYQRLPPHTAYHHGRNRLVRKPSEPALDLRRKLSVRSASLGSDSSSSLQWHRSPHPSIEEEEYIPADPPGGATTHDDDTKHYDKDKRAEVRLGKG